jgi:hypothetical protein
MPEEDPEPVLIWPALRLQHAADWRSFPNRIEAFDSESTTEEKS